MDIFDPKTVFFEFKRDETFHLSTNGQRKRLRKKMYLN